jgi:hypothetical protein
MSLAAFTAVGCTDEPTAAPLPLVEDACDQGGGGGAGSCGATFVVDGITYHYGCTAAAPAEVRDEVFADGVLSGQEVTAHALEGLDVRIALAVDIPGGGCSETHPVPLSDWSLAFNLDAGVDADAATCAYQLPRRNCA